MLSKSPYETFLFRAANAGYRSNLPTRGKPRRGRFLILTCEKAQVAELNLVRRGWCLGDETFRQELLAQMRETIGAEHYGEERAQTAEAMAAQIIAAELKRRRWKEAALRTRPKGGPAKVALVARLRAETTMTVGWIAERLGMGSRGYLNHLLYRQRNPAGSSHYQEPTPKSFNPRN
jgi:hypothetical protein